MKSKDVLKILLKQFYPESGGLAWGYIEGTTIGDLCGKAVEMHCIKLRAAMQRSAKLQQATRKGTPQKKNLLK